MSLYNIQSWCPNSPLPPLSLSLSLSHVKEDSDEQQKNTYNNNKKSWKLRYQIFQKRNFLLSTNKNKLMYK